MTRFLPWLVLVPGCDALLDSGGKDNGTDSGTTDSPGSGDDDDNGGGTPTTEVGDGLECDASYPTPAPGGALGSCVTEEVHCGDVIYGTLAGGSTTYDYDYWESLFALDALFGEYSALDGEERVYVFRDTDVDSAIRVTVHSCFDLWADWIIRGTYCDTSNSATGGVFESGEGTVWYTERIDPGGQYEFEFVIEGLYGATGNYALTVECF